MTVVNYLNEKYNDSVELLLNPQKGAKLIIRKINLMGGIKQLLLFGFISGFLSVVLASLGLALGGLLGLATGGSISAVLAALINSLIMIVVYLLLFIPLFFIQLIGLFILCGLMWGIAKLLGGKSDFGTHFGVLSYPVIIVSVTSSVIWGFINLLGSLIIPFSAMIGEVISLIGFAPAILLGLYGVWISIAVTAEAHQIELWKASVSVILPVVLIAIIATVLAVVVSFLLGSLVGLMNISNLLM